MESIIKEPKTLKLKEPKILKLKKPKTLKIKEPKTLKIKEPKILKIKEPKTLKIKEPKLIKNKTLKLKNKDNLNKMDILISNFKLNGITVIENLSEKQLADLLTYCNDVYYNTKISAMTDNEYDIIKEYMEKKYPNNKVLKDIGANPVEKNKVQLPYEMWSMDKIKPDSNALDNWTNKYSGPYVISCKLDGVSGLYSLEGNSPKLYTRGNGKVGQDISHLLKYISLPIYNDKQIVVRGEFIIPKNVFNNKYKETFANPRNLVSGIINSKNIDAKIKDMHFVVYELIQPILPPSKQMETLLELGFEVVQNETRNDISNEILSNILVDWRKDYMYEIDGIIVSNDAVYSRKEGNPEHAFAFKMVLSDQIAEAKVVDVIWNASKDGYLKPRVRIEPVNLGGVKIEYATGFNGNFIEGNQIGIGAIIQIIRSGDVIPHIKSVTVPAEHAKMPTVPYHWTESHIDIILDNLQEDESVREKNNTYFMTTLEIEGLSAGNMKRIMKTGNDTISKILKMSKDDLEKVEGFKSKMADKIYNSIQEKIKNASLADIMIASNIFGRGLGKKKLVLIMDTYPDILLDSKTDIEKTNLLKKIGGIGEENAKGFISNISEFLLFLKECELEYKLSLPESKNSVKKSDIIKIENHPLQGKKIVMTKIRDTEIINKLKSVGGILDDNIGKNTFALIVKSKNDVSNKTKYAIEHNIPIFEPNEFKNTFLL